MKEHNKLCFGLTCIAAAVALNATVVVSAFAAPVGIASGQPTGTNHPMIEDVKAACSTPTSPITNVVTNGSIDNIFAVYNDKATQYGISQEDALVYQQGADPKMMNNIVMVFPFFSTEMHLVVAANSPIRTLADLQGKRVVEGPDGSGTWVSTQVIKGLTKLQFASFNVSASTGQVNGALLGQADGLKAVLAGQADAMFINAGVPVKMLETARGVRLVPMIHPALDQFKYYTRTVIPSTAYPMMGGQSIPTYKVRNGLITYNYRNQYQVEIGQLVTCITRKLPELQAGNGGGGKDGNAHPKWRDVNPIDIDAVQWPVHPAAARAIKAAANKK